MRWELSQVEPKPPGGVFTTDQVLSKATGALGVVILMKPSQFDPLLAGIAFTPDPHSEHPACSATDLNQNRARILSDGNEIQAKKTPNKPRSPSGVPASIWFFRAAQSPSFPFSSNNRAVPGTYQRLWRHLLDMCILHPSKKGRRGSVRWGQGTSQTMPHP